jgi:hypothetical protein
VEAEEKPNATEEKQSVAEEKPKRLKREEPKNQDK